MTGSSVQECVSLLIQKIEDSSVSREEMKMILLQLHESSEELHRYSILNYEANKTIEMLKSQLSTQDAQIKDILRILIIEMNRSRTQ